MEYLLTGNILILKKFKPQYDVIVLSDEAREQIAT